MELQAIGWQDYDLNQLDFHNEVTHIVVIVNDYDRATRFSLAGSFIGVQDIFVAKYARTSRGDSLKPAR